MQNRSRGDDPPGGKAGAGYPAGDGLAKPRGRISALNRRLLACLLGAGASVGGRLSVADGFPRQSRFQSACFDHSASGTAAYRHPGATDYDAITGFGRHLPEFMGQAQRIPKWPDYADGSGVHCGQRADYPYLFDGACCLWDQVPEWMALVPETPSQLLVAVLCLTIIPAVSEELLFRGLIQGSMAKRWSKTAGIWISALLFALMHRRACWLFPDAGHWPDPGNTAEHTGASFCPFSFIPSITSVPFSNFSRAEPSPGMMMICVMAFVVTFRSLMKGREPDESQGHRGFNGAYPVAYGACSGYLVMEGDKRIMLDFGSGVLPRLTAFMDPGSLTAIVMTHWHFDHGSDLSAL